MNFSAVRYSTLRSGDAVAGPRDRLQEMRLAEAHAGMDVERVEHHRLAAPRQRDLLRCRMGERVGAADREGVEHQPRIERRAAERIMRRLRRELRAARIAPFGHAVLVSRTASAGSAVFSLTVALRNTAERTMTSISRTVGSSAFQQASSLSA